MIQTVVGEMALIHAHQLNKKGIYTTPLKALSNQKYTELIGRFKNVGLSTGDISINKGATVTVMTTEVYRNQAARWGSDSNNDQALEDTAVVVLDEFHYMGLPGRGSVWEESVITSPDFVQMVALSATLSNAQALAKWIEYVTQRPTILVQVPDSQRPVPIRYMFATRDGLYPLFRDPDAGPGAPHGMLGWNSADETVTCDSNDSNRFREGASGFSGETPKNKMPRGLQVNPALKAAAEKRMHKVQRSLERAKLDANFGFRKGRQHFENNDTFLGRLQGTPTRKLSGREERKERERLLKREMRRAVPSLSALVRRLHQKELLPAIFFIFSRAGCDEAARGIFQSLRGPSDPSRRQGDEEEDFVVERSKDAKKATAPRQRGKKRSKGFVGDTSGRTFRAGSNYLDDDFVAAIYESELRESIDINEYSGSSPLASENWDFFAKAGLLSYKQVEEVANRIAQFNKNNPEIAFDDEIIEQYLYGLGSHHAGQLPAQKSFTESLFQKRLMKAVFATETLAAGINMPARTTVICALAKRGDGSSMNLLETSAARQMSGRCGRRGLDDAGTCIILATPFESENEAAKILTDKIKPITSQFTPSYTLAVNLIARGEGSLDVAKKLVGKSFAMWEKSQVKATGEQDDAMTEILQTTAQETFMTIFINALQNQIDKHSVRFDAARIETLLQLLNDRESLKQASKSFLSVSKMLEVERETLGYLMREFEELRRVGLETANETILEEMLNEDEHNLATQIDHQEQRVTLIEKDWGKHPFTTLSKIADELMREDSPEARLLVNALRAGRQATGAANINTGLTPDELFIFAKAAVAGPRKKRKLASTSSNPDALQLIKQVSETYSSKGDSWSDMLAITKTLVAYGCLTSDPPLSDMTDLESCRFVLTPSGVNVGMLGSENSLWCLVAMGGAWDVIGSSSRVDSRRQHDNEFDTDWYGDDDSTAKVHDNSLISNSQMEAADLTGRLRAMSPSEIAGYVSCLVSDNDSRGNSGVSITERFHRLTRKQQGAVRSSMVALDRLMEIQMGYFVDEKPRKCSL